GRDATAVGVERRAQRCYPQRGVVDHEVVHDELRALDADEVSLNPAWPLERALPARAPHPEAVQVARHLGVVRFSAAERELARLKRFPSGGGFTLIHPRGTRLGAPGRSGTEGPQPPRAYFFWTRAVSVASKSMSPFPVSSLPISVMLRAFPTNMPGFAASAASMSSHQVPVVVQVSEEGAVIVGQLTCAVSASGVLLNFGSITKPLIV